ncbi:MAG: hypothetical protein EAZ89_14355, partial [Bacteroidetes bacterium]
NSPTITHTFTQALQSPENQHLGLPVILSLTDSSGCSNSDTLTLYLFAPVPAYTADTLHQCNGDTLLLRAAAGDSVGAGNLTFAWWANGLTPDTLTGRTATLFVPWGNPWILSLSVSDSLGCTATLSDTLELEERRPQANFSAFPVQATCPPLLVHFTDLSIAGHAPIVSWNWNFGDGSSSLLAQPSKVFASQGVFGVSLSITDSLGCTDFFNIPDLIRLSGVDGSFQVSDDTICARDSVLFIASSPNAGSYTWDFGDGNLGFGQTFLHHYEFPGEIYPALVMEDPLGLCSVTLIDTMRIYPVPSVPLPIDTAFCEGGSATYNVQQPGAEYLWSTGATSPDITLTESGNYNVKIIFPESGCFGETNIALTVWPAPEVSLGADRVLCEGDTILVLAQSADTLASYAWTAGTVLPTGPDRRYLSPRSETTLGVEVRDLRGCPGEDTIRIEVVPFPVIDLAYDPLCIGDTLLLDATPTNFNPVGAEYFWLKDGTATGDLSPQIAITEEGLYEVWFTLQECRTEADTEVIFNPLPESDQYERIMNCVYKGEPVTLDAGEHWGYFWEHSGEFTRTVEVVDSSVYYFRVYNEFDCSVRDSIEVIDACPPKLYVPTAFTPNGDGHNEAFGWAGDYIGLFDMQIYSRWGMLLYQTSRLSDVWDATYSGEVVPEGVYVWRVVYNGTHPDWRHPQELAGTVTVFR